MNFIIKGTTLTNWRLRRTLANYGRPLVVILASVVLASTSVFAQSVELPTGNGFRISPVRSEITVEKGKSQVIEITVENPADEDVNTSSIINNFLAGEDESGSPRLILDESILPPKNDFKPLVQPIGEFSVPANGSVVIPVTISVPDDANSGGYYGAIRFVPLLPGQEGQNVALTASVGTIVLLLVPGDLTQSLNLEQLSASDGETAKGIFIGGDVSVLTRLKNTGDIHVKPFGKVQIHDFFGNLVYEYEFNETEPRSNVLPDSTRKFIDGVPEDKQNWLGRYTISSNIGFSQGSGDFISAKTTFWYFSTAVFFGLIACLLLVVAVIYWMIRRIRKKRRKTEHHY